MKAEETIITILEGGAGVSPLGSHAFLDEFALAYHRAVAERRVSHDSSNTMCRAR
jgi:hypothetical protein